MDQSSFGQENSRFWRLPLHGLDEVTTVIQHLILDLMYVARVGRKPFISDQFVFSGQEGYKNHITRSCVSKQKQPGTNCSTGSCQSLMSVTALPTTLLHRKQISSFYQIYITIFISMSNISLYHCHEVRAKPLHHPPPAVSTY